MKILRRIARSKRWPVFALLTAAPLLFEASGAAAQSLRSGPRHPVPTPSFQANFGTLGVISGGADGTYIRIAADLANVLDSQDIRVLPIIGRGSLQNLRDIMFLRGVDIGIVQMDARETLKDEGLETQAAQRLRYLARLYNEEVHVLASKDVTDIRQLEGQKINIDKAGSGTNLTARIIFEKLGVRPDFTTFDQATSYEKLRSGEIKAAVYVAGRPVRAISEFQGDGRFHLLPIPFESEIAEVYFPARFTNTDYPRLVEQGGAVDTLAVGSVLAVFNWPEGSDRYGRVERFVNAFFSKFEEFQKPGRHPKWREVNLTASVPGWERMKPAQLWIDRNVSDSASVPEQAVPQTTTSTRTTAVQNVRREMPFPIQDFVVGRQRQRARGGSR
jgi:TRAP transporter TAXI family solute receptor